MARTRMMQIRPGASTSRFKNKWVTIDGKKFSSIREGRSYIVCRDKLLKQEIKNFECQKTYPLAVNGIHVCNYIADFVEHYFDGTFTVIDAKGVRTPLYKLKKKLMLAIYGIQIRET